MVRYSDNEIAGLIRERKQLSMHWRNKSQLRPKWGHQESLLEVIGESGNEFHIIRRRNIINPLDFSVILAVRVPQSNRIFRLRRYNGKSHEHTNHIEGDSFYDYHIHMATERYQEIGGREDAYAEVTDRYTDSKGALDCMLQDANFALPLEDQLDLFI